MDFYHSRDLTTNTTAPVGVGAAAIANSTTKYNNVANYIDVAVVAIFCYFTPPSGVGVVTIFVVTSFAIALFSCFSVTTTTAITTTTTTTNTFTTLTISTITTSATISNCETKWP